MHIRARVYRNEKEAAGGAGIDSDLTKQRFEYLIREAAQCKLCERMTCSSKVLSRANGRLGVPVMFIGEAPGRLGADASQIPFHGDKAGDNFERLIAQVGISRYDCFVTNAVLCNPRSESGNNATPTKGELKNCAQFLKRQIDLVNPQIVVTLGAQSLATLKHIESHALELADAVRTATPWYGRTLVPAYHPGQRAMVHRSFLNQLSDFQFLSELLKRKPIGARNGRARSIKQIQQVTADVVRALLESTAHPISYFKLHKLFYLTEYNYVRRRGARLTNAYIIRQKDGPYVTDLHFRSLARYIDDLVVRRDQNLIMISLGRPTDLFSSKRSTKPNLPADAIEIINSVVRDYASKTDAELKTASYLTAPMRDFLRREKYRGEVTHNVPIDMLHGIARGVVLQSR